MLEAQRGNVTLITALTAVLLTLMVLMATGLAQTGAGSNNMQASADQGALAAAEGYLASLNDQAFLDSIQWGVDAIPNLGHAITVVAAVLASSAAIAAATLFGAGVAAVLAAAAAVLFPIGSAITGVGSGLSSALKPIFSALRTIISVVKWIAAELNSALIADGNGYNGFMIPVSIGDAPGAKLSAGDIKNKATVIEQAVVDYPTDRNTDQFPGNLTTLKDTIRLQGLTYFWRDQTPPTTTNADPTKNQSVSVRSVASYHITDAEKGTLKAAMDVPFQQELDQLTLLKTEINDPDPKKNRFDDTSGSVGDVNAVLDRVIGELNETINGGAQPSGSCEGGPDPTKGCPQLYTANPFSYIPFGQSKQPWGFGSTSHRNNQQWVDAAASYFSATDRGQNCTAGGPVPGGPIPNAPPPNNAPFKNFVYKDTDGSTKYELFADCGSFPAGPGGGPPDVRSTDYFGQIYGGDAGGYATWIRDANKTIKGKSTDADDGKRHLTFLEFKALEPTVEENLTARLSGHETSNKFAVALSQADVVLAKDPNDKISFRTTCRAIFKDNPDDRVLGFIPSSLSGICTAIADLIINAVSFINNLPLGMDALAKAILGDTPEVRTYHAVLRHIPPNQYVCDAVHIIQSFSGSASHVLQSILSLIWSIVSAFVTSPNSDPSTVALQILDKYNCNASP
ncbi:MAG: hypothetical protein QOK05_2771 [Chloroflexota bacterium]|jgi:hypothetical protein|nr:hypothetical protein [Chloroflexota bacterium]